MNLNCLNCGHPGYDHIKDNNGCAHGNDAGYCACECFVADDVITEGGVFVVIPKKCTDCADTDSLLLSENGTDECDTWRCLRCFIKHEVKQGVAEELKKRPILRA